jgi:hypothetical protein
MATKKVNILDDVSRMTTVPYTALTKLSKQYVYCICNAVEETTLAKEPLTYINVGFGTLVIQHQNEQLRYQFIPSKLLSENLAETVTNGKNPLVKELEASLVDRILNTYKDLI